MDVPRAWLDRDSSEAGSVARRFRVVGPVVGIVLTARVRRVLVATGSTMQFLGERPEVRLVSAVLQVACDLGLLGLGSAASHRIDPFARFAGGFGGKPTSGERRVGKE